MDHVLQDVAEARASATASLIAICSVLPQGWAFQLNNNPLMVTREFGPTLSRLEAQARSSASGAVDLHGHTARWWRLFDVPPIPEVPPDKSDAYARFDRAWGNFGHSAPSRKSIDGRVSGLLGANLNGALDLDTGYGYLLFKLGTDPLYETEDFRAWLAFKAASRLPRVAPPT